FVALGIAITRRTALQDVADVYVVPLQVDGFNDLGQQLARSTHERQSLFIFISPRGLAYEHQVGVRIPRSKDNVFSRRSQLAALAFTQIVTDCRQAFVRHGNSLEHRSRL